MDWTQHGDLRQTLTHDVNEWIKISLLIIDRVCLE